MAGDDTIGGVDEAGRGPWAGCVMAAVVVLRAGQSIEGVRDSKLLTPDRRLTLAARIRAEALAWALGRADVGEIDNLNILNATFLAMRRAVAALALQPALLQVDGNRLPALPEFRGRLEAVVGGDRSCPAISAASILAKVERDQEMCDLDRRYPHYGFAAHKGYGTAAHHAALARLGPCPEHRRSFRPVRELLGQAAAP
jgi:ribonuclease HII